MKHNVLKMMVVGFTLGALWFIATGPLFLAEVAASDEVPDLQQCESQFETCKAAADSKKEKKKCRKKYDKCGCTHECAVRRAATYEEACETAVRRYSESQCGDIDAADIPNECGGSSACSDNGSVECRATLYDCVRASCERELVRECVANQTEGCVVDCLAEE
ncbi:MAG: hypothetical protein H6739_19920 [Alphaproteobacteria bacterium]|nr:hypothetical protein [Alphaproteobacteria bacterium]